MALTQADANGCLRFKSLEAVSPYRSKNAGQGLPGREGVETKRDKSAYTAPCRFCGVRQSAAAVYEMETEDRLGAVRGRLRTSGAAATFTRATEWTSPAFGVHRRTNSGGTRGGS